jgi:hypothetical protein
LAKSDRQRDDGLSKMSDSAKQSTLDREEYEKGMAMFHQGMDMVKSGKELMEKGEKSKDKSTMERGMQMMDKGMESIAMAKYDDGKRKRRHGW